MSYILPQLASLELLAAEYLRETNMLNFKSHLLMVTFSLDALKKTSKKKEMGIKQEKVEGLQQTIYSIKETGKQKIEMMKFLSLTLYLVTRITLTLISSPAIISCFRGVNFQGFSLVI